MKNFIRHSEDGQIARKQINKRHTQSGNLQNRIQKMIASLVITGVLGGGYTIIPEKPIHCNFQEAKNLCEHSKLSGGEISENLIDSFEKDFSVMKKGQFALLDENENIIKVGEFPKNWNNLSDNEKQKFRDENRKQLGETYGIPYKEVNMRIISPHGILKNSDAETMIDIINKNSSKIVIGDQKGRTRIEYIRDEFANLTENEIFNEFARKYIIGLVGGESQYDNSSHSHANAIGIFQLVPKYTIENPQINPKKYSTQEVKLSLMKQVELAKNLMLSDFKNINNKYTKRIAEQYFNGNEDEAMEYVVAPLVFNSYNTGQGNLQKLLGEFLKKYPSQQAIAKDFGRIYSGNMKMDVYYFMTQYGRHSKTIVNYGPESSAYTYKSMAMANAINGERGTNEDYVPPHKSTKFQRKMTWIKSLFE